jgi:RHS repeat-associated protein
MVVAVATSSTPVAATGGINPGAVTTFAGSGQNASVDGYGTQASFGAMTDAAVMNGALYVAEGSVVRAVNTTTHQVTTVAGTSTAACSAGTTLLAPHFTDLRGMATDGTSLYIADYGCNTVWSVNLSSGVTSLSSPITSPTALTIGPDGKVYLVGPNAVWRRDPSSGVWSSLFTINGAYGIGSDSTYIWVSEFVSCTTSCTTKLTRLTTAGAKTSFTSTDGSSLTGTSPELALLGGYVYTSSSTDNDLVQIPTSSGNGTVTAARIAGTGSRGWADGTGTDAWLNQVAGIASDGTDLWVADGGNHRLREVTAGTALPAAQIANSEANIANGQVIAFAGSGSTSITDGFGRTAGLGYAGGSVVVGGVDYLTARTAIRAVDVHTGRVSTLAGAPSAQGCAPSADPAAARFTNLQGIDSDGHYLYAVDEQCAQLLRVSLATGATSVVSNFQQGNLLTGVTFGADGKLYVVGSGIGLQQVDPQTGVSQAFGPTDGAYGITSDATYLWLSDVVYCGATTSPCYTGLERVKISDQTTTTFAVDPPTAHSLLGTQLVSAGSYLYATDYGDNDVVQFVKPVGTSGVPVSTIVAGTSTAGDLDGLGTAARFHGITGIGFDGTSLWVADSGNAQLRRVSAATSSGPAPSTDAPAGTNPSTSCPCMHAGQRAQVTRFPVNVITGNFWHTFSDLSTPGRGYPLDLARTYNSDPALSSADHGFGYGWSWTYGVKLTVSGSTATVDQEDGSRVTFTQSGSAWVPAAPRYLATLLHNADGTWTMTRNVRQTLTFDSTGRLTAIKDLNGYTTTVQYPSSTSTVVTDPAGRTLTFTLSGGRITSVADTSSPARTLQYQYNDGNGNLTDVIDLTGGHSQFTYDSSHRLLTMRSPRYYGDSTTTPSPVVTNVYNASGRVSSQSDQLGRTTTFDYTTVAGSTIVTDPKSNKTLYTYGSAGVLTAVTRGYTTAQAATWQYFSDPATLGVSEEIDPNGHVTSSYYDAAGNPTTTVDPLGRVTLAAHDTLNDVTSTTDGNGVTTAMAYDSAGNLLTTSRPLLDANGSVVATATSTLTYGDPTHPGDVTRVTDPTNRSTDLAYDVYGNVASATDALGNKTTFGYNTATGWRTSTVAPKGNVTGGNQAAFTTSYSYDNAGRVTQVKDPLWVSSAPTAHQQTRHYDADGNLDYTIDGDNNRTDFTHDAAGGLTVTTRLDGTTLKTDYFADGSVQDQKDGLNNTTTYTYDALGREATSADPLGNTTAYGYDGAGNLLTRQVPGGNCAASPKTGCVSYLYDIADQITGITYSDGTTPNVTNIAYDGNGRRTSMTDGTGTSTWAWDSLGRLTKSVNGAGSTMQYGYDLAGRITSMTYPNSQSIGRGYDSAGRWQTVTDFKSNVTTFSYDANSNIAGTAFPGAAGSDAAQFDNADEMTGVSYASGSPAAAFAGVVYSRGGAGELLSESQFGLAGGNHAYNYTTLSQLAANNRSAVIDAAINSSAAVKNNNSAWDWGDNTAGEIGNGGAGGSVAAPFPLGSPLNSGVTGVAGGQLESFNLALRSDGSVWAWGDNSKGELGDGTTTQRNSPVQVPGLSSVVSVAGGGYHSMALKADGTVWDWGGNAYGQLGNNSTANSSAPVQVPNVSGATAMAAGEFHTLAVDSTGRLWTWGRNASGQLGDGTTTDRHAPVQLAGIGNVVAVAAGNAHTVALRGDGTVWAWGTNSNGQLGNSACTTASPCLSPVQVPGLSGIVSVGAGSFFSFAIDRQGRLWAWGANSFGQLGDGTTTQRNAPVLISGISGVSAVSGGLHHAVAAAAGGQVYAWGDNSSGQLGNTACTSLTPCLTPTLVTGMNATGVANYAATYDGADNATQFPRGAAQGFDAADRLCWSSSSPAGGTCASPPTGSTAYSYNGRGDQTAVTPSAGLATSYGYDLADRLTSYAKGTTSWSYAYDGDGLRSSKSPSGGTAVTFTYDVAEGLPLIASDGSAYYITGPGGLPLEQTDLSGNPTAYYHHDQIGSTRALTSPTGAVSTFSWSPWGQSAASSGSLTTPFGWAGQYADSESGLVWLRARYYSPSTGQFLSRDPLVAQTRAPYSYAADSPLNYLDRSGAVTYKADGGGWEPDGPDIDTANFAQKTYDEEFQDRGTYEGMSIDDLVYKIDSGEISASSVQVNVILREGNTLILNTRSAQALMRAGVPRCQWNVIDRTGDSEWEGRIDDQLARNGLDSDGWAEPTSTTPPPPTSESAGDAVDGPAFGGIGDDAVHEL